MTLRWDMLHWLRATSNRDLTYIGDGATSNSVFGYGNTETPRGGSNGFAFLTHRMLGFVEMILSS